MASLFWIQLRALIWKNWVVVAKYPILNIFRCFILPVAYGIFLAIAQIFLSKLNNYGIGDPVPIHSLQSQFDGSLHFVWTDGTTGTSNPTPLEIIDHITASWNNQQRAAIKQVDSAAAIPDACPQNFNLFSQCFAAVSFTNIPGPGTSTSVNYTIHADAGLAYINVKEHTSDWEKRILPLQWAIDSAIIELQTGIQMPTPLEWPFTQETNEAQETSVRLSYVRAITDLLVLALFITFVGIVYQLPGSIAGERANGLTGHMRAMGLLDKARIAAWHISISSTYLPAWIIISILWRLRIWSETNVGIILVVHVLFGFSLTSWSFFVAAPFGKSPQLAAVVTTFLAIILAVVALVMKSAKTGTAFIFTLIFPPSFYVFATRAICGFEDMGLGANAVKQDPVFGLTLIPLIIAALINVFLWPWLAVLWERRMYEARSPTSGPWWKFWSRTPRTTDAVPSSDVAISVRNLRKVYRTSRWTSKNGVTAVDNLSFDVPKTGIFVLLGSNGAGKSTTMSIVGGLDGQTDGQVVFEGGHLKPPRGSIGIVPQKNVLFPELTCLQTLRVWRAVKWSPASDEKEDLEQLLKDCDLGTKVNFNANALSGGQKRKLQLAIGLLGGSKIVLVDECTSGVDPLSRRAIWRTLTSFRSDRAIVFTTHFLDEADLLADEIAILAAPGKLVASGSPVALKRDLGEGYSIFVTFNNNNSEKVDPRAHTELLGRVRTVAPEAHTSSPSLSQCSYHLKSKDPAVVQQVLDLLERESSDYSVTSYDILGTTIEDIFLDLMAQNGLPLLGDSNEAVVERASSTGSKSPVNGDDPNSLRLANGRPRSPFSQALTIFHKRVMIAKRAWLTPTLTILVAVAGTCIPLVFIAGKSQSCVRRFRTVNAIPLYAASPIYAFNDQSTPILAQPPGITQILGQSTAFIQTLNITDNNAFINEIRQNYRNITPGGVSLNVDTNEALIAWEARPPGFSGSMLLNLASNLLYNRALEASGGALAGDVPKLIQARYSPLPGIAAGTLISLRWIVFFGAIMAVYPAFYALYVSRERRSSVQAMQLSNGLSDPIGLWLGHLLFDTISVVIASTIIVIVLQAVAPNNFFGLGFLWFIMVIYGITAALFAYCASLWMASPLAAFAAVAGYQFVVFVLYLCGYLLTMTYGNTTTAGTTITIIHFVISIVAPVCSVARAALVSVNMFTLLCDGRELATNSSMAHITRYGGPILYLFVYMIVLLAILVWADSGSYGAARRLNDIKQIGSEKRSKEDVAAAAEEARDEGSEDLLRVLDVSKTYVGQKVVDDVSFSLPRDTVFALLGPNGAGKTTTFNMIRGDVIPETGDVLINGTSVIRSPRVARSNLGVCPQFTAIDSQLTVREHLYVYARLKGLQRGTEVNESLDTILKATALDMYADRLASKLSGGNQRKVALAIALIGNPSVILIDEFSTGIDPKMKRDMWHTLRKVSAGKAVIITTHSMEEASALANKVGILAKRMLAVGTTESLAARYGTYEVHFTCRTREEVVQARELMSGIPGAKMADDVATRFEVPVDPVQGMSLARLFHLLSSQGTFTEYTVEKASLESIFLKVIRENDVKEEDSEAKKRWCGLF
ncbi:nod factor export ATP-binding protein I [Coprinopsis marcescibilis]|uniref:Nod factor export ATP-binding protein I n=1 Tax=Coprinopsis marcescibilis TaxID=230819 RepID=A0A5C3KVL6_COPMA|nr:nod factor export ATP-binding protein I [Coprinopsis marcescibilis]